MDSGQFKDIKLFLARCMFGNEDETGKVKRFVITHLSKRGKDNGDIGFVPVDSMATADDVDNLINEIELMVNADAAGIGEDQRYVIRPTFANPAFKTSVRHILRVTATRPDVSGDIDDDDDDSFGSSSSSSSKKSDGDIVSVALMRHLENLHRLNVQQPAALLAQSQRTISRLQDSVTELHDRLLQTAQERLKVYTMVEDMLCRRQERELAAQSSEKKMELMGEMGSQLLTLAPMIVNKISGKNVLPQTTTPAEAMLKEWFKTLTREQFEAMLAPLTPQQQFPLLMMYQEMIKVAERDEEIKKAKESKNKPSTGTTGTES
jgi:hypothetical protein